MNYSSRILKGIIDHNRFKNIKGKVMETKSKKKRKAKPEIASSSQKESRKENNSYLYIIEHASHEILYKYLSDIYVVHGCVCVCIGPSPPLVCAVGGITLSTKRAKHKKQ